MTARSITLTLNVDVETVPEDGWYAGWVEAIGAYAFARTQHGVMGPGQRIDHHSL